MLYAPFVRPADKVKNDVSELSFSDFQPKRMALAYDPPTIVLEYMVPSTGKLYHHKMRLRQLKPDSNVDEMMEYLQKRHPLYFMNKKISKTQIKDLVRRLKYRLASKEAPSENKNITNTNKPSVKPNLQKEAPLEIGKPVPLASVNKTNGLPSTFKTGAQLPALSDGLKTQNKEATDEEDEDEDFGEDFNANELLDFSDYQKRK